MPAPAAIRLQSPAASTFPVGDRKPCFGTICVRSERRDSNPRHPPWEINRKGTDGAQKILISGL